MHVPDFESLEGIVSARRFKTLRGKVPGGARVATVELADVVQAIAAKVRTAEGQLGFTDWQLVQHGH